MFEEEIIDGVKVGKPVPTTLYLYIGRDRQTHFAMDQSEIPENVDPLSVKKRSFWLPVGVDLTKLDGELYVSFNYAHHIISESPENGKFLPFYKRNPYIQLLNKQHIRLYYTEEDFQREIVDAFKRGNSSIDIKFSDVYMEHWMGDRCMLQIKDPQDKLGCKCMLDGPYLYEAYLKEADFEAALRTCNKNYRDGLYSAIKDFTSKGKTKEELVEAIKDRLVIDILSPKHIDSEVERIKKQGLVIKEYGDIVGIVRIRCITNGEWAINATNELRKAMGLSTNELFELAAENTQKLYPVEMRYTPEFDDSFHVPKQDHLGQEIPIELKTPNGEKYDTLRGVFYPQIQEKLNDMFPNGGALYIEAPFKNTFVPLEYDDKPGFYNIKVDTPDGGELVIGREPIFTVSKNDGQYPDESMREYIMRKHEERDRLRQELRSRAVEDGKSQEEIDNMFADEPEDEIDKEQHYYDLAREFPFVKIVPPESIKYK